MEQEQHPLNLGKLLVNFHALEAALRLLLFEFERASDSLSTQLGDLHDLKVGDVVPENAFTNWDSLRELIDKYNNNPKIISSGLGIDRELVDIRDALAHGRIFGKHPLPPFKLVKFNQPRNKQVKVTFSVELTQEWLMRQQARVQDAFFKVVKAKQRLQRGDF